MSHSTRALVGLVFLCSYVVAQTAAEHIRETIWHRDVAISPDGKRVAWVETSDAQAGAIVHVLNYTDGPATAAAVRIGGTAREDESPAWSPDSRWVAFVSDAGAKGQRQVWVAAADGSSTRKLTSLTGYAERPRWSPDGSQIAFLYIEGAGGGGPLVAGQALTGEIDSAIHNQRIAVVDVAGNRLRQVSPADLHVYDYDWSPDGKRFAATAAPGPGDNNWWIAQLHVIDIGFGAATAIYKPTLQVAVPRWSPDGKRIAFIEGLMSDEGIHGGDVYTGAAGGGKAVNHTRTRASSPTSATWLPSTRLLLTEWANGGSALSTLDTDTGATETLWKGNERVVAGGLRNTFAIARDGVTTALEKHSLDAPPEVWIGPIGEWKQMTRSNSGQRREWGKYESVEWTNEGHRVQGWLLAPKNVKPGARYPMVVWVHGGPSSVKTPDWPSDPAFPEQFALRGYFVFFPNPRGSYGEGEAYTQANVKDFGGGDLRDIMKGIDAVVARYPVDSNRLGMTGWSYGGFMTMWAVTQTNRFRAAIAGAGIANWISYYGQNEIDKWMIPFFGASVYDDPNVYEKSSPIRYIKNVKTPTLVVVGERDAECPAPQSFEFWHALKTLGVPTRLVVFPGEGHMFVKPENQRDLQTRMANWFDRYLNQ